MLRRDRGLGFHTFDSTVTVPCGADPVRAGGVMLQVYHAVKQAVYAARADMGQTEWIMLDVPLTPERIRTAVGAQEMPIPSSCARDQETITTRAGEVDSGAGTESESPC